MNGKLWSWEEAVLWLRNQPDQQRLVQQCYYDDPVLAAAERFSSSEEWQAVLQLLHTHIPGKVLDIGAGRGISSYAFAKAQCGVTALEPNPSSIVGVGAIEQLTIDGQPAITITQATGETLPFPAETFDVVYGRAVLHHAQDLAQFCAEASRVLRSGGIFLATREHVISKPEDLPLFLKNHPLHWLYGGENAHLLSSYIAAINKAGLRIEATLGPYATVINYSPMIRANFKSQFAQSLARILGGRVSHWLAHQEVAEALYGQYRSWRSSQPGRLYSFLALKP